MLFSEVLGQKPMAEKLLNLVNNNRLSHALLLLAPEGSGGLLLALSLAQYVVCEKINPVETGYAGASLFGEAELPEKVHLSDACNQCASCKKAKEFIHPDIHFSYPVTTIKKDKPISTDYIKEWRTFLKEQPYGNLYDWLQSIQAENKQGNITSHECADILHKMSLKSFESRYKVLIMWMPEMLGNEGNKLLKLIEEPPEDTLFIFVAESQQNILPTILSRLQLIAVPRLQTAQIQDSICSQGINPEKARQVAAIAHGNMREALQLLQHPDDDWEVWLRDWLNAIVKTGPLAQIKWIDEVSKLGREKQKQFILYFTHLLHHAIRIQVLGVAVAGKEDTESANDFANRLNKLCNLSQQNAIVEELDKAFYYIERNANAKMLFHALTIRLYQIISNKTVILTN